jgi:thiol:disulfide interchange protein
LIWTFTVDQISKLMAVPWQEWPVWKLILLLLILAAVIWALYRAGRELLEAGAAILAAFAGLLAVLVQTLPSVFLAGVIALGGVWLVNHLDNSFVRMPSWMQASQESSPQKESSPSKETAPAPAPSPQKDSTPPNHSSATPANQ